MHANMDLAAPISRIMTFDPVTVAPGARASEARALLVALRVHHLPVVRGRELVGIVTTTDLRRVGPQGMFPSLSAVDAKLDCFLVGDLMTPDPVVVSPDDSIEHAVELLRLDTFSALPVVDGTDLVGIVTSADVLGYMIELLRAHDARRLVEAGGD